MADCKKYLKVPRVRESILFFCISVGMIVYALVSHSMVKVPWKLSPYLFPLLIAVFLLLLSFSLFLEGASQVGKGPEKTEPLPGAKKVVVFLALCFAYYVAMPYVGFLVSDTIFLILLFLLLGERVWWRVLALSVGSTVVIYYLFHVLLHVMLP